MRNNKLFKKISCFVAVTSLMIGLCGCSGKNSEVTTIESADTISFSWWGNDDRHIYTMDGVDAFEFLQDGRIKVECNYGSWNGYEDRMRIYMKSKNTPDVMLINYAWIEKYSPDGNGFYNLYDLGDYIELDNYTADDLSYGEVDGKLNAIPITFNAQTLYYNKTLLDSYGLAVPKTWDDLFKAAKVLSKDDIYTLGMSSKSVFFLLISYYTQTTGKSVLDANNNINLTKEDIGYMLDFYYELYKNKVIQPIDDFNRNAFSTGKIAGSMAWVSDAGNYCDPLAENGAEVVVGEYIRDPKATSLGWYVKPATMYAISNNTDNPEAAGKFLNFLLNSEEMALLQGTEKGIPISNNAFQVLEENHMVEGFEKLADDMREEHAEDMDVMVPILESDSFYGVFKDQADYYIYDKATRDEVIDSIYNSYYEVEEE